MKKNMVFGFMAIGALLTSPAFAAFTPEKLVQASKVSLDLLTVAAREHLDAVTGFKTWKSGDEAQVKFTMDHGGMEMEFNYKCQDTGTTVECQVVP